MAARKRKKAKAAQPKRPPGRPKIELDLGIVERLAQSQASIREMAGILGISEAMLRNRIDTDPSFCALIEKARSNSHVRLRRKQWRSAMKGNPIMQIWLGKQYLGQSDKASLDAEVKVETKDPRAELDRFVSRLAARVRTKEGDPEPESGSG